VYEIGALRALDEVLEGVDFNDLESYVGVSGGAVVAACLVNGMTPSQLVRAIVSKAPDEEAFVPGHFFMPAYGEMVKRLAMMPALAVGSLWEAATRRRAEHGGMGALLHLARALPVGLFDNEPIRRFLAHTFSAPGRSDDFRSLRRPLTVVATDLDAGVPIRFGAPGLDHVPISRAVQASTALPGLYPPVRIEGRDCVDGVLLRTVHASIALEQGVKLLICVNPIVPTDLGRALAQGAKGPRALIDHGLPAVLAQTFRTLIHSRLDVGLRRYATRFPDADIVLIEPTRDEYALFFSNVFSFSSRRAVCELAYRSTRRNLLARRATLEPLLRRHGVRLRTDILEDESRDLWAGVGLASDSSAPAITSRLTAALMRLESETARRQSPRRPRRPRRPHLTRPRRGGRATEAGARRAAR